MLFLEGVQNFHRRKSTRKKSTQNKKRTSEKVFLNNGHWVPASCHREGGKSSRQLFERKKVVLTPRFGVGLGASKFIWRGRSLVSFLPRFAILGGVLAGSQDRKPPYVISTLFLPSHFPICPCRTDRHNHSIL